MNKSTLIPLFLILFVSLFLRIYGLNQQGLTFIDEGTFIYRAKTFQLLAEHSHNPIQQPANYADKKILWLLSVMAVLSLTDGSTIAVQLFSVLLGLLSILFTFVVAQKIYGSREIGLLSAAVLGVSNLHIFYSRLAMPEMLNSFWVLLMVLFYLNAMAKEKSGRWAFASGVMMSFSFLTNVFRAGLMPIALLFMNFGIGLPKTFKTNKDKTRWGLYLLTAVLSTVVLVFGLWQVLKIQGIWLSPYADAVKSYIGQHSSVVFSWPSFLYALSYIFFTEGKHYAVVFFWGLFFIRGRYSTLLPLLIIGPYVLAWAFVDEKAIRALTPVLPFIAMYAAVTIYNIYGLFKPRSRLLLMAAIGLLIVGQLVGLRKIYTFRSDLLPAIEYIKQKNAGARVLTTNQPIALAHDFDFHRYAQLTQQTEEEVRILNRQGFNYLITDFVKYAVSSVNGSDGIHMNPFVMKVEKNCIPLKTFPHFNEGLQRWMLMEVNQYAGDVIWLDHHITNQTGQLRVYDLDRCLEKI